MQTLKKLLLISLSSTLLTTTVLADSFTLSSKDIRHGEFMAKAHEFKGFGCDGGNLSPQLSWSNTPEGTKAFAVFAYDPDAPTGSGWWHWQAVNLPVNVTNLPTGAGTPNSDKIAEGSVQISNDYGQKGFGGACPPPKNGAHRYQFTVHALSKKLELPDNASAALTGYLVNAHSLASSTIEALYKRD